MITKLAVNHVYKSLIRQSDNLATAKDRQLQQMKTKYESLYRMNCGIKNSEVFVTGKTGQYRLLRIRLNTWNAFDLYAGTLAVTVGLLAAFGTYWWDGAEKMSVLYLGSAALAAIGMLLFHSAAGGDANRAALENALCHYFENVLIVRGPHAAMAEEEQEESVRTRTSMKDDIFMRKPQADEQEKQETAFSTDGGMLRGKSGQRAEMEALKESLSQIAAARSDGGEKKSRKLTQKEEQLIDEILRQYLS